jgi:NADH-quinone oxidoreductase subunit A
MASPTAIVAYLALFIGVGILFLFANLLIGKLVRPNLPNREKLEVYECGEPAIGSSYVQFDLRFYVVALLFIIFDVEVAFFFPWATVFGKATQLTSPQMQVIATQSADPDSATADSTGHLSAEAKARYRELGISAPMAPTPTDEQALANKRATGHAGTDMASIQRATIRRNARKLAFASLADIGVFFAVLMVGFAYVWRRGDLDWVRSVRSQTEQPQATRRQAMSGQEQP